MSTLWWPISISGARSTPFRSAKKAALLSLLMPGIGDLYLRQFVFGTLELLGSTLAALIAIPAILPVFFGGVEDAGVAGVATFIFIILPRLIDYGLLAGYEIVALTVGWWLFDRLEGRFAEEL